MTKNSLSHTDRSPFHDGEHAVQKKLGVRHIEDWARKVVYDHLPEQHREFHSAQPFLVVSARDELNRPWITLLDGPDSFVTSPNPKQLMINATPSSDDALSGAFKTGMDVGILGIEFATRRRNRVNGRVISNGLDSFIVGVDQAFGNCPQYIRERGWRRIDKTPPAQSKRTRVLTSAQREWIESSDTFFIATGFRGEGENPTFGMDASHRGGERGFVNVLNDQRLRFPDYAGNNHYNTIGNLVVDPRTGLLFLNFETGSLLQLTGTATIDWNSEELNLHPGARRLVSLDIEEVVEVHSAVKLRWDAEAESVRSLRLVKKVPESKDVTSFIFEARDGGPLTAFEPGQHLPIEISLPGVKEHARRTYSLSSSPSDDRYRITVKREPEGLVSGYLHSKIKLGAIIDSRPPAGDFMITCNNCPLVLVSAGVGVTPMVSILNAVAKENGNRPVWFVHGVRDGEHHPLADEVRNIAANVSNCSVHVAYSQPRAADEKGIHFDSEGRVTGALLADLVQNVDAHYFLCGPSQFMAEIQSSLEKQGISLDQIHFEIFGPQG